MPSLDLLARDHPRLLDWSIRLDRLPPAAWLAAQAAALAPHWLWMLRRLRDGAGDPLGPVEALALAALALLAWRARRELRASPRLGWLAAASAGTLAATVLRTGIAAPSGLSDAFGAFGAFGLPGLPDLPAMPALLPLAASLLAVLALASGLLAFQPRRIAALPAPLLERCFANHFVNRVAHKAGFALVLLLCLLWSALPVRHDAVPRGNATSVADCYRALGYGIAQARLERDLHERLWRCFVAERKEGPSLRVCERIEGAGGDAFTDTSAWYWAAVSGRSTGP